MSETRVNGPTAGVSGLTLGGRRLAVLDRVRVYACGITPYDVTHLGHAATFVWVDALVRTLHLLGAEPEVCRNVTDVDDVLDEAARRAGEPYDAFAAVQQYYFDRDMAALNVRDVAHEPRARRYVDQVIRLADGLLAVGAAYMRQGSVYFRGEPAVRRSGLDLETALRLSAEYGGRPDDAAKDDPLDVAVWQASEPGHPVWESPWGLGRPGWHAECVAMALSVFGAAVDVHAGGTDLRFPHHAYHAAMAEAFTGVRPHARAWLHVGTVRTGGTKMAKSAGNLVLVRDLADGHSAAAVRLMILDRPWDKDWDYSPALLDRAEKRLED
ncbi:MAG TPA: class I tRNA ligase family protein, partial [Trebonia sp.]